MELNTLRAELFGTRCGRGKERPLVMSCLVYGRLTSAVFSISTTLRIYFHIEMSVFFLKDEDLKGLLTWIDRNLALCLAAMSW